MTPDELKHELEVLSFAHFNHGDRVSVEKVNLTVEKILNAVVSRGALSKKEEEFETDWGVDAKAESKSEADSAQSEAVDNDMDQPGQFDDLPTQIDLLAFMHSLGLLRCHFEHVQHFIDSSMSPKDIKKVGQSLHIEQIIQLHGLLVHADLVLPKKRVYSEEYKKKVDNLKRMNKVVKKRLNQHFRRSPSGGDPVSTHSLLTLLSSLAQGRYNNTSQTLLAVLKEVDARLESRSFKLESFSQALWLANSVASLGANNKQYQGEKDALLKDIQKHSAGIVKSCMTFLQSELDSNLDGDDPFAKWHMDHHLAMLNILLSSPFLSTTADSPLLFNDDEFDPNIALSYMSKASAEEYQVHASTDKLMRAVMKLQTHGDSKIKEKLYNALNELHVLSDAGMW